MNPKVFLDTNILKYAVDRLNMFMPTPTSFDCGGNELKMVIYSPVVMLPNEKLEEPTKSETKLLPKIAEMAKNNKIELMIQAEVMFEFMGLPKSIGGGLFYGAPINWVDAPFKYSRPLIGSDVLCGLSLSGSKSEKDNMPSYKREQIKFLKSVSDSRYLELQKICGAYQGEKLTKPNQLVDAFHLYCAEHTKADYFLTCEAKLVNMIRQCRKKSLRLKVVRPSELLQDLSLR